MPASPPLPGSLTLYENARIMTVGDPAQASAVIDNGAIVVTDGRIAFVGPEDEAPSLPASAGRVDCEGRLVTPGLIDCHTHLVYAGDRAHEFEMRLTGATYEEIARAGGGIVSTVAHVRAASDDELLRQTLPRLDALIAEGVTTVEVKSGYGLDADSELRMLRVARRLGNARDVTVRTSFLGAHAVPPEFRDNSDAYIDLVVDTMLPAVVDHGLADAVDAFCESIAFSPEQVRRVFDAARDRGLPVKLHADQLTDSGGGALVAEYGGLSADHLEYAGEASFRAMADAGTVAVLLPGAFYFLRETHAPNVAMLREYRIPIAIATDANPGTSPLTSILLTMNMAATLFGLTVDECLAGVTINAARALGMADEIGSLEAGKRADLAIWDVERPAELVYRIGFNPLWQRVWGGRIGGKLRARLSR